MNDSGDIMHVCRPGEEVTISSSWTTPRGGASGAQAWGGVFVYATILFGSGPLVWNRVPAGCSPKKILDEN